MAKLLHADALQQLEVALLGSPASNVVELLSAGLERIQPMQPCPQKYTASPPVSLPVTVPVLGISTDSSPAVEETTKTTEPTDAPVTAPQCHHITLVPVTSSVLPLSSTSCSSSSMSTQPSPLASYPVIVIPELAIPAETYPEWINQSSQGKDYLCCLHSFHHTNYDCILTHIRKHLDITIICPGCGKGFQNAASLHKHGKEAHQIKIVTSSEVH